MTTMLEKAARAYNARLTEQNREEYMRWEELGAGERAWEIEAMRAALMAIREPDAGMVEAGEQYDPGYGDGLADAETHFTAMIDAILAEKPESGE